MTTATTATTAQATDQQKGQQEGAEPQAAYPASLTHSSMRTYSTCVRKYYLAYVLRIRPAKDAEPLRLGSAYHLGLEVYGVTGDRDAAIEAVDQNYADPPPWIMDDDGLFAWRIEQTKARELVRGWIERWQGDGVEVLQAEQVYSQPIINPETGRISTKHEHAGKRDQLVRLPDGRLALREFKTTGDDIAPTSDYWRHLRIDPQISGYFESYIREGVQIDTVLYDVCRKPSIAPRQIPSLDDDGFKIVTDANGQRVYNANGKPRQSADAAKGYKLCSRSETPDEYAQRLAADIRERPEWYYQRQQVTRLEGDLTEFRHDLWQTHTAIQHNERYGHWPRTGARTGACVGPYGRCPYLDLCSDGWDSSQGVPEGFKQIPHAHAELESNDDAGDSEGSPDHQRANGPRTTAGSARGG